MQWKSKAGLFCALSIGLSACSAPLPIYYKEGETLGTIEATLTECRVESLEKVPVSEQSRYIPPKWKTRRIRTSDGRILVRRTLVHRGGFETFDANAGLRADVTNQCMISRGFRFERVPGCNSTVTRATTIRATEVLPPLTTDSCVIRIRDDKFQIVTP